jgi:Undecaprenyl-phosphate galactose phosphotransferase WbaP
MSRVDLNMPIETVLTLPSVVSIPRRINAPSWSTSSCIVLSDFFALSFVFFFTVLIRQFSLSGHHLSHYVQVIPCLLMLLAAFATQGLYPGVLLHPAEEMRRIFFSITTVFLIVGATTFLWRTGELYSRSIFLIAWIAGAPFVLLFRYMARRILGGTAWWGVPAIILGAGDSAQRIVRTLRDGMLGIKVTAVVAEGEILEWANDRFSPASGSTSALPLGRSRSACYAIVAMPNKTSSELRDAVQEYCRGFSHVLLVPDLQGLCSLGITAREIGGQVALEMPQKLFHRSAAAAKRALDLTACIVALLLLSPLFLAIAAAIKVTSRGPVFFGHSRYGRDGLTFKALKFRTMRQNSDLILASYLALNPEAKIEWELNHKLKNDPRVTAIGRWLRRFSLDELPQLLNVAVGQMSLVGPRPIVSAEIAKYGRGYELYTRVLPGITGLWQVSGRNNTTYDERVSFDEYYVRNWSVWFDIYILIRTLRVVLTAEGAY